MREIEKVAVLGAGVMGSGIAAHLANANVRVLLLDIVPPDLPEDKKKDKSARNALADKGLQNALSARPAAFFIKEKAELIETGNFEDDLPRIKECDWIIEAVVENLEIKKKLFEQVDKYRKEGSIVSTNTSGLSIRKMAEGRSQDFRKHFLGTHFFNPVRYMRLLEIIPGDETDPSVIEDIVKFCTIRLGKGIVYGKDTPNFIANRIGVYGMMKIVHLMAEMGYEIDEIDKIFGPALGRPKSAVFGTADLVGLDTLLHVAKTVYDNCPEDEERNVFKPPEFIQKMVEKGLLGRKSKAGFFKLEKDAQTGEQKMFVIDYRTLNYREEKKYSYPSLQNAKMIHDVSERIKSVITAEDRAGEIAWKATAYTLVYSANRLGEIADDIVNIDTAMKLGFNWAKGPFETWDIIGVKESVERMEKEGIKVPQWVKEMLEKGFDSFYKEIDGTLHYYDPVSKKYKVVPKPPELIILKDLKKDKKRVVYAGSSASLIDIGDDVLCLELHSALVPDMNPIDDDIVNTIEKGIEEAEKNYKGLVITSESQNFSAGANVMLLLMAARNKDWKTIENIVKRFQYANRNLRLSKVPVVSTPFGFTLGGGAELAMGADRICAHAETYMGLVEVGVGLIPGGGGTLQLLIRHLEGIEEPILSNLPFIRDVFMTIATAKVSTSAEEARKLKFLRKTDKIVMNRDLLLHTAKKMVIGMYEEGYERPQPVKLRLPGLDGVASIKVVLMNMRMTNQITEYEQKIGEKLAYVLCGGDTHIDHPVDEEYILELEREAFLSLCGEEKTQERMEYFLKYNKVLRN